MKESLGKISTWMKNYKLSAKLLFIVTGIISTLWFLIRVIPKPSRASYPCMRTAAPVMSGFVIYLLSLGGFALILRKARQHFLRARYMTVGFLVIAAIMVIGVFMGRNSTDSSGKGLEIAGPDDGPNQPMGKGIGIHPGRVIWVWDPKATNADCINVFDFYKPENTNQGVVNRMVVDGIRNLGGNTNLFESWDAIFRSFNYNKSGSAMGYSRSEKIFIKVNQGTAIHMLRKIDQDNDFDIPKKTN